MYFPDLASSSGFELHPGAAVPSGPAGACGAVLEDDALLPCALRTVRCQRVPQFTHSPAAPGARDSFLRV